MLLLFLIACGAPTTEKETTQEQVPEVEGSIEFSPAAVDFGTIAAPTSTALTLINDTSGDVTVLGASATTAELSFELPAVIGPGESGDITITWAPLSPIALSDNIQLEVLSTADGKQDLSVPVTGTASWPSLAVSIDPAEFGTVSVGCTSVAAVALTNAGTTDLVIDAIETLDGSAFTLTATDGSALPAFPWTVVAGGTQAIALQFAPGDDGLFEDVLQVHSNDPVLPVAPVDLSGTGVIEGENTINFTVGTREASTVLIAVNEVVTYGSPSELFDEALPFFFDTLLASGVNFRVAVTLQLSGEITGDIPYIDETFSTDDAMDAVKEMLSQPGSGDNDYLLDTLGKSIALNREWLLDESDEWADSKLTLVAINSDVEQSTGNATVYVSDYQSYKTDPDDIIVHAIAGDYPRGCTGTNVAEPAELLYLAADATGGTLYSFCTSDWIGHMEAIGASVIGERTAFTLTGEPAADSIEVTIDGRSTTTGWSYDAETTSVVFEDASYPDDGSEVSIHYLMAAACE